MHFKCILFCLYVYYTCKTLNLVYYSLKKPKNVNTLIHIIVPSYNHMKSMEWHTTTHLLDLQGSLHGGPVGHLLGQPAIGRGGLLGGRHLGPYGLGGGGRSGRLHDVGESSGRQGETISLTRVSTHHCKTCYAFSPHNFFFSYVFQGLITARHILFFLFKVMRFRYKPFQQSFCSFTFCD